MLQHDMIWMGHHNFFPLFFLWMWFSPEWPHGSWVHLRATIENYLRFACNQQYSTHNVSSGPGGQKSLSSLDYLEFPDAVQDRAFDPNRMWSLDSSEPELLHFPTVWPGTGISVLPHAFGREQRTAAVCWWLCVCVCVFWPCSVQGRVWGWAGGWICAVCLCKGGKFVLCLGAFISIALGRHKLCMWIWSPPENVGSRAGSTALGPCRGCVACKMCLACKIAVCWLMSH